jgi:hypothetical protein
LTSGVVINELSTRNGNFAGDEFIELYNNGTNNVPLANWTLRYAGSTGSPSVTIWSGLASDEIPAKGFLLITGPGYMGTPAGHFSNQPIADDGGIALFDDGGITQDAVGYGQIGAHPYKEKTAVGNATSAGYGIGRLPDGDDCNDNSNDFQINLPHSPNAPN